MAKIHSIDQKKEVDRQTALLALAATSKDAEKTDCLTADEMACLVDNRCAAADQEQFYNHLAHCEICYHQWVELSELTATDNTQKSRKNIQPLFQPRNLAWAGSALAVAASIVLFLNITGETPSPVLHKPLQTEVERSWIPSSPGVSNDVEQTDSKARNMEYPIDSIDDTVQPEMKTQASKQSSVSVEEKITPEETFTKKQKLNFSALKEEAQVIGASRGKAVDGLPRINTYQLQMKASEWIESIQQGCLTQKSIPFWKKQYQKGNKLIHFESAEEKKLVNDLLPLIEQLLQSSDGNIFICKRILKRLETNTGR